MNAIPYPERTNSTSFVWVYYHAGAAGDELRYSLRSVSKYFRGSADLVVCGDRAPWYNGPLIPSPRVSQRFLQKWVDCVTKLQRIIDCPRVNDRFVWMYDDQYFLRPFELADFSRPRASGIYEPPGPSSSFTTWQRVKLSTAQALTRAELPVWDYATHAPHVFEKAKLQKVIDDFRLHESPLLPEMIYGNAVFSDEPEIVDENYLIVSDDPPGHDPLVWSHGHGFSASIRNFLRSRFEPNCTEATQ